MRATAHSGQFSHKKKLTKKLGANYVAHTEITVSTYTMKAGSLVKGLDLLTVLSVKASDHSLAKLTSAVEMDKARHSEFSR